MKKYFLLVLALPLLLLACQTPQENTRVNTLPVEPAATTDQDPLTVTSIPEPAIVPKQNDLIFIEFFAGT